MWCTFPNVQLAAHIYEGQMLRLAGHACCADNTLKADSTVGLTSGYGGEAVNISWAHDPDVGVVVECNKVYSCTTCNAKVSELFALHVCISLLIALNGIAI